MRIYIFAGTALLFVVAPRSVSSQVIVPSGSISQVQPRSATGSPPPGEMCIAGRVFGITNYQCTSCGVSMPRDSAHFVYSFGAEPIVIETDNPTNRIKPGDAVVAVNNNPITTRAGADQFAYPSVGNATITIRRNGTNITIDQIVNSVRCPASFTSRTAYSDTVVRAGARGRGGAGGGGFGGARVGGGGAVLRADSSGNLIAVDTTFARLQRSADSARRLAGRGIVEPSRATAEQITVTIPLRNFGLALTCRPVCTRARARDGSSMYWRFDGFPAISTLAPGSLAAKAGLQDGDVLISVNGQSPLVEEGALLLNRSDKELTLRLEVSRAGKREKITLKL